MKSMDLIPLIEQMEGLKDTSKNSKDILAMFPFLSQVYS